MKNKKILLIVLSMILLLTSGCGSKNYIVDKKGKTVMVDGHSLQTNIYCKPSNDTEMYKAYKKYEKQMVVKLDKLPECSKFKINSNKTQSLWQFIFVKPLAYFILLVGNLFKFMGATKAYLAYSLICVGLIIRIIILPFNIKTQNQSKKMQELMPEMKKIEKKYANKTDQQSMMMKSQETMALYSKYKINPMLSCLLALIQLPIFFAFLQAIYKIPAIYEGKIFGWGLGVTPSVGIFENHQYSFIILLILIMLTTYFSFKYTMNQNPSSLQGNDAGNQMKTMLNVMTIVICLTAFSLPTAIALYWIATYAFIILQTYLLNKFINNKSNDKKAAKNDKNIKDKLKMKDGLKYGKSSKRG